MLSSIILLLCVLKMSCYAPITITNKKDRFNQYYEKSVFSVPCGKCLACRSSMQDEWVLRLNQEYKYTKACGGITMFLTFTYRPGERPYYHDDHYNFPCFNKNHITTFVDSFRNYLEYRYSYKHKKYNGIKYFAACEYGSDPTKSRAPHYHILLYLPYISYDVVVIRDLLKKTSELWSHGFVYPRYNKRNYLDCVVRSDKAIIYCSKYCSKDINFYGRKDIKNFLSYKENRTKLKGETSKPMHWQSKYFGKSLCDELSRMNDDEFVRTMRDGLFTSVNSVFRRYPIPRYIQNHLFKNKVYDPVTDKIKQVNNSVCIAYQEKVFDYSIYKQAVNYENICTSIGLKKVLDEKTCSETFGIDLESIREMLQRYSHGFTFTDIAKYEKVYRGVAYNPRLNDRDIYFLLDIAKSQYMAKFYCSWSGFSNDMDLKKLTLYSKLQGFDRMEKFIVLYNEIMQCTTRNKKLIQAYREQERIYYTNLYNYEQI